MSAAKDEVRRVMRARRRQMTPDERAAASRSVCGQLAALFREGTPGAARPFVAVYLATEEEIDLAGFIAQATVRLAAPKWNAEARAYDLAELTDEGTEAGHWGLREPKGSRRVAPGAVGAWIVPGLAFTRDGRRLGYGGGYYDRLLARADPSAPRLGVAHAFQILPDLPAEPHDFAMTGLVVAAQASAAEI